MIIIPRIIHQIWVGTKPPTHILEALASVKDNHPDYQYVLHENSSLKKYNLYQYIGKIPESYITNIMRVKILNEYGGYYIDADTVSHGAISELNITNEFATGSLDIGGEYEYQNAFIAVRKGYDFSEFLNEYVPETVCIPIWDKFCKKMKPQKIPVELFGRKSEVFQDLRIGSWNKWEPYELT